MADIEGLNELLDTLDEIDGNLVQKRKLIAKSLRKGAKPIQEEGARRIKVKTGAARESMSTSVIDQTSEGAEAQIGPKRFYAKFPEYGTIHQRATPWLGPSFDAKEPEALEIIGEVLGDGIEEIWDDGNNG